MTITVESTTIGIVFINSYTTARSDIALKAGINPITIGLSYSITERKPVILVTDDIVLSRSLFNA